MQDVGLEFAQRRIDLRVLPEHKALTDAPGVVVRAQSLYSQVSPLDPIRFLLLAGSEHQHLVTSASHRLRQVLGKQGSSAHHGRIRLCQYRDLHGSRSFPAPSLSISNVSFMDCQNKEKDRQKPPKNDRIAAISSSGAFTRAPTKAQDQGDYTFDVCDSDSIFYRIK
jgi:hypothetical protein